MIFCLYMCILMSKRLAVFLNSLNLKFFGLKMQKSTFFLRKNVLESSLFLKLTFRWLQTGLPELKNTKQLKFCLW